MSMRVVIDQFKQTMGFRRLYALNCYATLIPPCPRHERFIDANGLIRSGVDEEEGNRHARGNRHGALNVKVAWGTAPNCARDVPFLMRKADYARDRESRRAGIRGREMHGPESTVGWSIRPFLVGRDLCPLARGSFV